MTTTPPPFEKPPLWKSKNFSLTLLILSISLSALGFIPLWGLIPAALGLLLFPIALIICICQKDVWKSIISLTVPLLLLLVIAFQMFTRIHYVKQSLDHSAVTMLTESVSDDEMEYMILSAILHDAKTQKFESEKIQDAFETAQQSRQIALQLGASKKEAFEQMRLTIKKKLAEDYVPRNCPSGCSGHDH